MTKSLTLTWTALVLAGTLTACNPPGPEEATGGGGGQAAVPPVQQTRNNLGDAYVEAARVHANVVRGDYDGAAVAIRAVRTELADAKRTASLSTQTRINDMDQAAIRMQGAIERRAVDSYKTSEKLVDQAQSLFVSLAPLTPPRPAGGGGGSQPAESPPAQSPWTEDQAPRRDHPADNTPVVPERPTVGP